MKIWIDADACPVPIKEIIYRAASRTGIQIILVANHYMKVPKAKNIVFKLVEAGFDKADTYIEQSILAGDLVISNDIPLAASVIQRDCHVINSKGELLTEDNIKERLNMRDFMDTLRASGINTGGPAALSQSDIKTFADTFDRILTQYLNKRDN